MAKNDDKASEKAPESGSRTKTILDLHNKGTSPAYIAAKVDLDSLEVLAIIQEELASKSNG